VIILVAERVNVLRVDTVQVLFGEHRFDVMGFTEMVLEAVGTLELLVAAVAHVGTRVLVVGFQMVSVAR